MSKCCNMERMEDMKPHIYLGEKDLPVVKDWEVGKEYMLKLKVKQMSKSIDEDKKTSASFEVMGIDPIKEKLNKIAGKDKMMKEVYKRAE